MGNTILNVSLPDNHTISNYWADRGKELIDQHYARLQGVEEVCRELGISASRVRDVFRAAFGVSPKWYLIKVKIDAAKTFLKDERTPIFAVAIMVGFRERSVFEKAFKRVTGVTPSEYRELVVSGRF